MSGLVFQCPACGEWAAAAAWNAATAPHYPDPILPIEQCDQDMVGYTCPTCQANVVAWDIAVTEEG